MRISGPVLLFALLAPAVAMPMLGSAAQGQEEVEIELKLTGVATASGKGHDDGYKARIFVKGLGTRSMPNGNGVQVHATDLPADVDIVRNDGNVRVANYTALVDLHAQQASSIAHGVPGGFQFSLSMRGNRGQAMLGNEDQDERVLSLNAQGKTTGTSDDDGVFSIDGKGQSTTQPDGSGSGARHFNIDIAGEGSIQRARSNDGSQGGD